MRRLDGQIRDRRDTGGEGRECHKRKLNSRADDVHARRWTELLNARVQATHEVRRRLDRLQAAHDHQTSSNHRVLSRATPTCREMLLHGVHFARREEIINVCDVLVAEFATVHLGSSNQIPGSPFGTRGTAAGSRIPFGTHVREVCAFRPITARIVALILQ